MYIESLLSWDEDVLKACEKKVPDIRKKLHQAPHDLKEMGLTGAIASCIRHTKLERHEITILLLIVFEQELLPRKGLQSDSFAMARSLRGERILIDRGTYEQAYAAAEARIEAERVAAMSEAERRVAMRSTLDKFR